MAEGRIQLDEAARARFGKAPLRAGHTLQSDPLFTDAALASMLDRFPRSYLHALTMGDDPERAEENRLASHEGVSGAGLLEAVRKGRLWLNVTRVDRFEPEYRALVDALFAELARALPGFVCDGAQATLLISSPTAQVYYHADACPTALWHLRGRKRIALYPALDERFLARTDLEDILAGVRHEYLPFQQAFDAHATWFDLEPGQWVSWPQNAPHRVVNVEGLNVSLSTEFFTPESRRRARVYSANRFLRRRGLKGLSTREDGPLALAKTVAHRVARELRLEAPARKTHVASCRVEPSAPTGIAPLRNEAARGTPTIRCFHSFAQLLPYRDQIASLNARSRRPDPFSTLEFFETFVDHDEFEDPSQQRQLWFLAAFDGDRLSGYLALQRRTMTALGLPARVLEVLVTRDCDRPHLVAQEEDEQRCAQAMLAYLAGRHREWSYLELKQQDARSPFFELLGRQSLPGVYARPFPSMENGTIPLRFDSLAAYHQATSKKHRNNISRSVRSILKAGQVQYLSSDDPAVTPALLELYATIEPRSWKSRANGTITRHQKRIAFFRALLAPEQPMRVSIDVLVIDGVPIAGLINGRFGQRQYALQICYDAAREALAPGAAVLLMGVRRALQAGCSEYNLLSGFGYYKTRFLAEMTPTQSLQLFRKGSPFYWKARLGELKRTAVPGSAEGGYNRERRRVEEEGAVEAVASIPLSEPERQRIAELIARVRAGQCEALDNAGFAAAMPFDTRDPDARKQPPKSPQRVRPAPLVDQANGLSTRTPS